MAVREDSGLGPTEKRNYSTPPENREPTSPGHDFVPKDDLPPWAQRQFRNQRKAARAKRAANERAKGDQDMGNHYQDNEFNVGPTDAPFYGRDGSGQAKPKDAPTSPDWENNGNRSENITAQSAVVPYGLPEPPDPVVGPPTTGNRAQLAQTGNVRDEVARAAAVHQVPVAIALAVAHEVSGLNQSHFAPRTGRLGVMGIDPQLAQDRHRDPYKWRDNIDAGVGHLADLYRQTGSWTAAVKAYGGLSPKVVAKLTRSLGKGTELPKGFTGNARVAAPLPGNPYVSADFGPAHDKFHPGVTLTTDPGTPVRAFIGGTVGAAVSTNTHLGNGVIINDVQGRHWGMFNLGQIHVNHGQKVKPGDQVGTSTGRMFIQLQIGKAYMNPLAILQKAFTNPNGGIISINDSDFMNGTRGAGMPIIPSAGPPPDAGIPPAVAALPTPAGVQTPHPVAMQAQNDMASLAEQGPTSPELANLQKRQAIFASPGNTV